MMKNIRFIGSFLAFVILAFYTFYPNEASKHTSHFIPTPLVGKVIVLDPGHGGFDGGAVGADQTLEKEIALLVANEVRSFLEQAGAIVYMTRETDTDLVPKGTTGRKKAVDIRNRLAFIHEKKADMFLTIHLNALNATRWRGAQTFFDTKLPENEVLARMIQEEIIRNLENTKRVALQIDHIYLLKHAEIPGALVEIGFLSNEGERELLKKQSYQREMAASIYQGILRYMTESDKAMARYH